MRTSRNFPNHSVVAYVYYTYSTEAVHVWISAVDGVPNGRDGDQMGTRSREDSFFRIRDCRRPHATAPEGSAAISHRSMISYYTSTVDDDLL